MPRGLSIRLDRRQFVKAQSRAALLKIEIAQKAGLAPTTVSVAASGEPIGIKSARSIAQALGVPLNRLRADDDPAAADPLAAAPSAQTAA